MKELHFLYKKTWGRGPWQKEADKVEWVDPKTKYPCLIVRHPSMGNLCGYVGVPKTHSLYEVDYSKYDLDVHGGLTFSNHCSKEDPEHGICHSSKEKVWWFGFDCAHVGDLTPGSNALLPKHLRMSSKKYESYKPIGYVHTECTKLAAQLKDLEIK